MDFQLLEMPFAEGVDQKTNGHLLPAGKLRNLENGVFQKNGSIRKRHGYEDLSRAVLGSAALSAGEQLARFERELLLFNAGTLYGFSESLEQWVSRGNIVPCTVGLKTILRNDYQQSNPDCGTHADGITVFAWADGRGGVRAQVVDEESGTVLLADTELSSTGVLPRVAVAGSFLFVVYAEGTDLKCRRIRASSPTVWETAQTLAVDVTGVAGERHHDVIISNDPDILLFAYNANAVNVKVGYLLADGTVGAPSSGLPSPISIAEAATKSLTILTDSTGQVYVFYSNGTAARLTSRNADLTVRTAPANLEALANVENITAVLDAPPVGSGSSQTITVFYEVQAAATYNRFVKKCSVVAITLAVSGIAVFKRSVALASKAFLRSGVVYVTLAHDSVLQASYFVTKSDGFVIAKLLYAQGGGRAANILPQVIATSTGIYFACGRKGRFVTEAIVENTGAQVEVTSFSVIGVAQASVTFGGSYRAAQLGKSLLIAGGVVGMYDGAAVVENGFHLFTENATAVVAAGGSLTAGVIQTCFVLRWTDAQGQVHRSAPSVPISSTVALNDKVTYTVPTLRITAKNNVAIEMYSTEANGGIFYLTGDQAASPVTAPIYNSTTVDTVTIVRTAADATIIANEILYTQGGVLENIPPPASSILAVSKNRAFLLESETGRIWYSKEIVAGEGVAFQYLFAFSVDPQEAPEGDPTALATMDDKVVIFKRDRIYVFAGEGPNDLGQDNSFTAPVQVTTDVGAIGDRIGTLPDGLMFQSAKGLYRISRGLQVDYVGAPVEDAADGADVRSILLSEDENQCRVLVASGSTPVYDYQFKQWTLFTGHEGVSAVRYNEAYHYLKSDGTVLRQSASSFLDGNRDIHLKLKTAWLRVAGIQGFQRVSRVAILGDRLSAHQLVCRVMINFNEQVVEEFPFDPETALFSSDYGEGLYGVGVFGGASDTVYQFRHTLREQKCEAISFEIEDVGSNPGRAYSLSGIALEIGVIPGTARLSAAKTV